MSNIQKQILRKAIENPFFSKEILTQAPLSIFGSNKVYKEISNIIQKHYKTKTERITEEALLTLTESKLDRMKKDSETQKEYFALIDELYAIRDSRDDTVIDEEIEAYIKKHMRMDVLSKAALKLDDENYMDKVDKKWKDIALLNITGTDKEIINVIDDSTYKKRLLTTLYQDIIPTGFNSIDKLNGGGLAKKELGIIAALSGSGKTMILTNLATNYTKLGYNVFYIALEELESRMVLRFEQSMLRQNKSVFIQNGNLHESNFNKIQDFYKDNRKNFGNLYFSRYSPRTVTSAKIEQLISDITLRTGHPVDVVIIDYPELLRVTNPTGNEAVDGGVLFEEMRRIGQEYNTVMWTASQLNRGAYSADTLTFQHAEGSHRKKNAAELVLVVNQTRQEYEQGFTRLYVDKLRNTPEGPYDDMIGLRVIGSSMTVRDYNSNQERERHRMVLDEAVNSMHVQRANKKHAKDAGMSPTDYTEQLNKAIMNQRGGN